MAFLKKQSLTIRASQLTAYSLQLFFSTTILLLFSSCQTIDLYEKVVPIPKHEWHSSFKPTFKFVIKDTTVPYQLYIILRHNEKYNYNNIWLNVYTLLPGSREPVKAQYELPLATNDRGWLGTGMDDLYEHRIALTPPNEKFFFSHPGEYAFTLEQIMREDPLENVMNVGLRIEKKQP
ncbi:MAG: gliding motility lipoprotein GldH [Flavisolibacter sp.]|nr:gliding motility lipoprotein GldH [Flavisolibacter sp.]